jgi:hypothetical protein
VITLSDSAKSVDRCDFENLVLIGDQLCFERSIRKSGNRPMLLSFGEGVLDEDFTRHGHEFQIARSNPPDYFFSRLVGGVGQND